jgi:hypothetical protein
MIRDVMSIRAPVVLFLILVQAGIGCTPLAESSTQAEFSDSAGTSIVLSRSPRWVEGEAWTVSSELTVTIGVLDGPEEYQLVDVADAARRSDGSYVVADRGSQTVRMYDLDGVFLRTYGAAGSGPGEFMDPGPILVTAGDALVVWDQALLRSTRFEREGALAEVRTVDWGQLFSRLDMGTVPGKSEMVMKGAAGVSGLFPGPMEPLGDGSLLVRLAEKTGEVPPEGYQRKKGGALRLSSDFTNVDTLMFFGDTEQVAVEAPWGPDALAPPLARRTLVAHRAGSSRICIGEQETPEIVCLEPEGGRTLIRWTAEPVPITEAEITRWREATVQEYDLKLSRRQVLDMLDEVPIRDWRPPYTQLNLDPVGHLWVERGPTAGKENESNDFLVFDPHGVLLGTVALPSVRVLEIGLDYVLGVYVDELGIQYVRAYELDRSLPNVS